MAQDVTHISEFGQTHIVINQPLPLADYDLFAIDPALACAVKVEGAGWAVPDLKSFEGRLGQAETLKLGDLANRNSPILHTFDRYGRRRDEVEFHPPGID